MTPQQIKNEVEKEINIVSFGAGQNSTAMIIMMKNEGIRIDEIIYAETGNEMPETYVFLEEFKKWCKKNNLTFTEVKSKLGTLKDFYMGNKMIPYRMFRQCTHKFKVIPIDKHIQEKYGKKTKINMYMGISYEEKHRMEKIRGRKPITYFFPLVDRKIDRDGCVKIIKKEGLSVPVKSGCYFCPFQVKRVWIDLYKKHNDLFEEAKRFEKNGKAYPEGNFMGNMTLEDLEKVIKSQTKLFPDEDCSLIKCAWCHT